MNSILLIGSLQSFFLVILLISKRGRSKSDSLLGIWLTHIGLHMLIYFLYGTGILTNPTLVNVNASLPFMQGAYLYFYVRNLVEEDFRWQAGHLLHLLPAVAFIAYLFLIIPTLHARDGLQVSVFEISRLFTLIILTSVPVYILLSTYHIRRYRQRLQQIVSSTSGVDLIWLSYILSGMSLLWIVVIVINISGFVRSQGHGGDHLVFLLLTVFIYAIGYLGIRQRNVFTELLPQRPIQDDNSKYSRSGMDSNEAAEVAGRLKAWMENEQPYLDEGLTLQSMADTLGLPLHNLSQVINQQFGQNFYDFVNGYRVKEFISRMSDEQNRQFTILALALDSGFSSKASFNRIFKKHTGKAPSQYLSSTDPG